MDRFLAFFRALPKPALYGGGAVLGIFVLALVVGLMNRPTATPATVSAVRPTQGGAAAVMQQQAAPVMATAPTPAPAPSFQGGASMDPVVVMRPAQNIDVATLKDCARESLGIPADGANSLNLDQTRFGQVAQRDECKFPALTVGETAHDAFAQYVSRDRPYQISRGGLLVVDKPGQYTFSLRSTYGRQRSCALYVDDMAAPLVVGEDFKGEFSTLATTGLDAGAHEVALVCSFASFARSDGGGKSSSVSVAIRGEGEQMPTLVNLKSLPDTPAIAAPTAGAKP